MPSGRHRGGERGLLRLGRGAAIDAGERKSVGVGAGAGADVAGDSRPHRRINRYSLDYMVQ